MSWCAILSAVSNSSTHHDEVLTALRVAASEAGATPDIGSRIQADRGSALVHLGLRTPLRRRRVKQGFAFTTGDDDAVLAAWDRIWQQADVADVMFAPLDHYRDRAVEDPAAFWAIVSGWIDRIDNWAHADDLARVYSRALEASRALEGSSDVVYAALVGWSTEPDQWRQRIAMVSLIHYTGKHANFMPPNDVLAVVANCVADDRAPVSKAVGWVLRETMKADKQAVLDFMATHEATMSAATRRRALS